MVKKQEEVVEGGVVKQIKQLRIVLKKKMQKVGELELGNGAQGEAAGDKLQIILEMIVILEEAAAGGANLHLIKKMIGVIKILMRRKSPSRKILREESTFINLILLKIFSI